MDTPPISSGGGIAASSPKVWLAALGLVLVAGVVTVSLLRDRIVNRLYGNINVTGQAKVPYAPDVAEITFGVQVDKVPSAETALQQLSDKGSKVMAAMQALGIEPKDIKTQNFMLNTHYDYVNGVSQASGYNANQQVVVKVRFGEDQAKVSSVVGAAIKAGANQLSGITFTVSDMDELKERGRREAMANARAKSSDIAAGLGVKLGKVIGWYENVIGEPQMNGWYGGEKGGLGGGGGVPVPVGSGELVVEVSITYSTK